jgi:DNA-binding MarR family transcriptional regulator
MDEIVLDKKTFKALAMESRIKIMKALKERRKTQSELSKELCLAPSTVSEHLEKMLEAGLISRKKDHHKWIYYELTEKGNRILSTTKASTFVFAISLTILVLAIGFAFLNTGSFKAAPAMSGEKLLTAEYAPETAGQDYTLILAAVIAIAALSLAWSLNRMRKERAV